MAVLVVVAVASRGRPGTAVTRGFPESVKLERRTPSKRQPTPGEVQQLEQAAVRVEQARRIFETYMRETEVGKWELDRAYTYRREEARQGLQRARRICGEAGGIIERLLEECGAGVLPEGCAEYGKVLRRIEAALAMLAEQQ